jgi:hypothetical protein
LALQVWEKETTVLPKNKTLNAICLESEWKWGVIPDQLQEKT